MNKILGAFLGISIVIVSFLALSSFSSDIQCNWFKSLGCDTISQAQADSSEEDIMENNQSLKEVAGVIATQNTLLNANQEKLRLNAQQVVSQKAIEQRELLKQDQVNLELELEKQKQYQAKLMEEGKAIVARYEAQRQKRLTK